MDLLDHNRLAWNKEVSKGNPWTLPATEDEIAAAQSGEPRIVLTPHKPVPMDWLGELRQAQVLCLASGGGQQGPVLAAAGAQVTVFDNSEAQLERDRQAGEKYNLPIKTVQGNMQDLSVFPDRSFDLIVHPVSNCFIDEILPVWRECYRVLRSPGRLLAGFCNPLIYMIDWDESDQHQRCVIVNAIPYSDLRSLSPQKMQEHIREKQTFEFGHSLSDQIQGQIAAGFMLTGLYEDKSDELLDQYADTFIATRAVKE